jgi:trigger factor
MLQYRGQSHDEAVDELKPQAEERLKSTLALREIVLAEGLTAGEDEVDAEVEQILGSYEDDQRDRARQLLSTQLRSSVASTVIDKKLRERLFQIATGVAPELGTPPSETSDQAAPAEASEETTADVAPETAEE